MHRAKGDRFVRASELPVCDNDSGVLQFLQLLGSLKESMPLAGSLSVPDFNN